MTQRKFRPGSYDETLEHLHIRPLSYFSHCRDSLSLAERRKQIIRQGHRFRGDFLMINQQISFFRSFDLVSYPYPVRSAFGEAANLINPYLYITHRLFIIQFRTADGCKTLLFSPSDTERNQKTPYFRRLKKLFPGIARWLFHQIVPVHTQVEDALQEVGITPDQVDFISFDHLHAQDLRRWLGSSNTPSYFPNARLLVMHQEWEAVKDFLPYQREWYCPDAVKDIPHDKVLPLHSSVLLGNSLALIHTPGHTMGSHSLVVNTEDGICVCSHNGISVDNYNPEYSRIYGIRDFAEQTGTEVIPNGTVQEAGLDQYLSMILEKTIADPHPTDRNFSFVIPTTELKAQWHPFALAPTISLGRIMYGQAETLSDRDQTMVCV